MHHVFKLPEMLQVIATSVQSCRGGRRDLLSLAITNRSISDVALDILWEDQIYLDVLLQRFPINLWNGYDGQWGTLRQTKSMRFATIEHGQVLINIHQQGL